MAIEYCPRCGNGRTGAFRFCRSCGFDFEDPADQRSVAAAPTTALPPAVIGPAWPTRSNADEEVEPEWKTIERTPKAATSTPIGVEAPPAATTSNRGSNILGVVIAVLVMVALIGSYQTGILNEVFNSFGSAATGADTIVEPTADIPPAGTIWFGDAFDPSTFEIAHRAASGKVGDTLAFVGHLTDQGTGIQVRLTMSDTTTTVPTDDIPDGSDIAGGTLNLLFVGPMLVEFIDVGGNVLASGRLHVSE